MESRETMRALPPPTVQASVAAKLRHACGAHAQHLGGLGGCHGRNVGKLNAHRQGDDGLTVKSNNGYTPRKARTTLKRPQSCKVTLQDS